MSFADPQATWNQRFAAPGYLFGTEPNSYLVSQRAALRPGNALAVADGEGRNGVWLAEQGLAVTAFDFSAPAVDKARALARQRQVEMRLECCAWQNFSWPPGYFDNVVGIFFQFTGPDDRAQLFRHIDACLKPGGTLIIQGYGLEQLSHNTGGPGRQENLYDEALLRSAFPNYELLDLRTYEATLHEGSAHCGRSALVGMSARKHT